jgi:hypothetical protein
MTSLEAALVTAAEKAADGDLDALTRILRPLDGQTRSANHHRIRDAQRVS